MQYLVVALALLVSSTAVADGSKLSDAQIRRLLIKESIAEYDGNCPCPYNRARNGSLCGRRSAYDREGGEEPLCFDRDVTAEMIESYRQRAE